MIRVDVRTTRGFAQNDHLQVIDFSDAFVLPRAFLSFEEPLVFAGKFGSEPHKRQSFGGKERKRCVDEVRAAYIHQTSSAVLIFSEHRSNSRRTPLSSAKLSATCRLVLVLVKVAKWILSPTFASMWTSGTPVTAQNDLCKALLFPYRVRGLSHLSLSAANTVWGSYSGAVSRYRRHHGFGERSQTKIPSLLPPPP